MKFQQIAHSTLLSLSLYGVCSSKQEKNQYNASGLNDHLLLSEDSFFRIKLHKACNTLFSWMFIMNMKRHGQQKRHQCVVTCRWARSIGREHPEQNPFLHHYFLSIHHFKRLILCRFELWTSFEKWSGSNALVITFRFFSANSAKLWLEIHRCGEHEAQLVAYASDVRWKSMEKLHRACDWTPRKINRWLRTTYDSQMSI